MARHVCIFSLNRQKLFTYDYRADSRALVQHRTRVVTFAIFFNKCIIMSAWTQSPMLHFYCGWHLSLLNTSRHWIMTVILLLERNKIIFVNSGSRMSWLDFLFFDFGFTLIWKIRTSLNITPMLTNTIVFSCNMNLLSQ